MQIESILKDDILILRILENLDINSELSDVKEVIKKNIKKDIKDIAVSLTPNSRLSSTSIGQLLRCYSILKESDGKLTIIQPNEGDSELLSILSLTCVIDIFKSEDELLKSR